MPRHLPYRRGLVEQARAMRKEMTPAEKKLWHACLRHFPHRVLRQRPIDRFIVDFYCPALKLVIEVDGDSHAGESAEARDAERTQVLEGYGLRVVRFANAEVLGNIEGVSEHLRRVADGLEPLG